MPPLLNKDSMDLISLDDDGPSTSSVRSFDPERGRGSGAMASAVPETREQKMEVHDGKVTAQVHDTLDLRASFLHYCGSSMRPTEMQLAAEGPFMSAQQYTAMARDLGLVEPEGAGGEESMFHVGYSDEMLLPTLSRS